MRETLDEYLAHLQMQDRSSVTLRVVCSNIFGFRSWWEQSMQESIDTTTSGARLIFHIFGALAEFERNPIRERTQAGLATARARGRKGAGQRR